MSIESVMPSNHLILCHPLLLLPSIFPSIRVFSNESVLHYGFSCGHVWIRELDYKENWATFDGKVMSLLFNILSRLVIAFLPRSKHLLISWLQTLSAVILDPKKIKSLTVSIVSPSICHEVMGPDAMILVFWMLSFKPTFFTLLFHFHQETFEFLIAFSHKGGVIIRGYWYFSQQSCFQLMLQPPGILHDVLCICVK